MHETLNTVIEKANDKRKKAKDAKKKKKQETVKNITQFAKDVANDVDAITIYTSRKEKEIENNVKHNEKCLEIIKSSIQLINLLADDGEENVKIDIDEKVREENIILSSNNDQIVQINENLTHEQNSMSEPLSKSNTFDVSPPKYIHTRHSKSIRYPEFAITNSDPNWNPQIYTLIGNVFNGKAEPEGCFLETFNHTSYKKWLPDLLVMYGIPKGVIDPVYKDVIKATNLKIKKL